MVGIAVDVVVVVVDDAVDADALCVLPTVVFIGAVGFFLCDTVGFELAYVVIGTCVLDKFSNGFFDEVNGVTSFSLR